MNRRLRREAGLVSLFSAEEGHGTIVSIEEGDELFVHYSSIVQEGFRSLTQGDRVTFTREYQPGPDGTRPVAFNVVKAAT